MNEKSKRAILSNEEKLSLMLEYMQETGKPITVNTEYKGYKLGHLQNNLRQSYFNGTIKMDQKLLEKFKRVGIIREERTRKARTSTKQKYDFLMKMQGKTERELEYVRMENGLTFSYVRNSIQSQYNRGELDLTPEQIDNLIKAGFLNYSKEEQEEANRKHGIPARYIQNVVRIYGSYEEFLDKYKKKEIDYDFKGNIFCGYRGITLAERDMPEWQKLAYCNFAVEIVKPPDSRELKYVDIDELERILRDHLTERESQILRLRFGLEGEKKSLDECSKIFEVTATRVREIETKAMRKLFPPNITRMFFGDANKDKEALEKEQTSYKIIQEYIDEYNKIKSFILDEQGKIKPIGENTSLSEIGIVGRIFSDGTAKGKTMRDLIRLAKNEGRIPAAEVLERPIDSLNLNVKTFRALKRNGIETIGDLTKLSKNDLARIRNFGVKSVDEVVSVLDSLGLSCREDGIDTKDIGKLLTRQDGIAPENINKPIEELGLSSRTISGLKRVGINTIEDFIKSNKTGLSKISHMGPKARNEIILAYESVTANPTNDKVLNGETEKDTASILEMCNQKLEFYISKEQEMKLRIDRLKEILRRYGIAYKNYLRKENLFAPNAIVPAVPKKIQVQDDKPNRNNEEQMKKEALLKSIRQNQNQLAQLQEILARFGLDDTILQKD